jgi:hypothetical protein
LNSNNNSASFWKNSEENVKGTTLTLGTKYLSFIVVDAWRAKVACRDLSKGWDITVASGRRRRVLRKKNMVRCRETCKIWGQIPISLSPLRNSFSCV